MKIKQLFIGAVLIMLAPLSVAQSSEELVTGYISDELFIYMHAGPGTNYRILGTVNAGEEIKLTGEVENEFSQIIDERDKTTWVETKYLTDKPGLRFVVAKLNSQLASKLEKQETFSNNISSLEERLNESEEHNRQLNNKIAEITNELSTSKAQLKNQDTAVQKEWFFNGAIVMVVGLILGLILPRLGGRKRSSMDSWK